MHCTHHPEASATAICTRCDHPLCATCIEERNGRPFCAECAAFLDQRAARRAQQTGAAPPSPAPAAPSPAPAAPPSAAPAAAAPAAAFAAQPQAPPAAQPPAQDGFFQPQAQNDFFQPQSSPAAAPPADNSFFQAQPAPAAAPAAESLAFQPAPASGGVGQSDAVGLDQPPAEEGLYQGPVPDEEGLYQGPAEEGLYQGPATAVATVESDAPAEGTMFRALLFGAAACVLSTGVWYGAAALTGKNFAILAWLIGWLVGVAVVAGAGRGGGDTALVAAGLFAASIFLGEWFIFNHSFAAEFAPMFEEAMSEAETFNREMASIELDGQYTDREARVLLGFTQEEWNGLSTQEKGWARNEATEEWPRGSTWEPADFEEVTDFTETIGISSEGVGLGAFVFIFPFYLGLFGWLFAAIGAWQAIKIPLAAAR